MEELFALSAAAEVVSMIFFFRDNIAVMWSNAVSHFLWTFFFFYNILLWVTKPLTCREILTDSAWSCSLLDKKKKRSLGHSLQLLFKKKNGKNPKDFRNPLRDEKIKLKLSKHKFNHEKKKSNNLLKHAIDNKTVWKLNLHSEKTTGTFIELDQKKKKKKKFLKAAS